jgi:hypothetical protein
VVLRGLWTGGLDPWPLLLRSHSILSAILRTGDLRVGVAGSSPGALLRGWTAPGEGGRCSGQGGEGG